MSAEARMGLRLTPGISFLWDWEVEGRRFDSRSDGHLVGKVLFHIPLRSNGLCAERKFQQVLGPD